MASTQVSSHHTRDEDAEDALSVQDEDATIAAATAANNNGSTDDNSDALSGSTVATTASAIAAATTAASKSKDNDSFFASLRKVIGKDIDSLRLSVPLFLLEPLSNLEYLAELEHPEFFANAPLIDDPLERFTSVVNVLASSFKKAAFGRKVKKPINPVLGEVFACVFTDAPGSAATAAAGGARSDSPATDEEVPLDMPGEGAASGSSKQPRVYLIGEQVSHHPPISAYYAVCPERRIDTILLYDLRAKFTGMNFQLINHSYATINIKDRGETYRLTYPSANVVGVLTMSFKLVWAGSCTVTCEKTGLKAVISFKEKKWFGRDSHEVTGTIHDINDEKKVHYVFGGNWDGDMTLTNPTTQQTRPLFSAFTRPVYASSTLYGQTEPGATSANSSDGNKYPPSISATVEAIVPPIPAKLTSHAVWKNVIAAMQRGDKDTANRLKTDIEEYQRQLEREGKAAGTVHRPRYFEWVEHDGADAAAASASNSRTQSMSSLSSKDSKSKDKKSSKKDKEKDKEKEYYPADKGAWVFIGDIGGMPGAADRPARSQSADSFASAKEDQ
ncbi:hypothetical protein RI367_000406 [Sorochytrium milnesiophthora]